MIEGIEKVEVHRGLKGVYFDRSRVCFIDLASTGSAKAAHRE